MLILHIRYRILKAGVKRKQGQQKASGIQKAEWLNVVTEYNTNNKFWAILSNCFQRQITKECTKKKFWKQAWAPARFNQLSTDPLSRYYYKQILCSINCNIEILKISKKINCPPPSKKTTIVMWACSRRST